MKAIVYSTYGSPDVLRCEEIEKPSPGDDELLIRVRAASINPYDWHFMRGEPRPIRMMSGLRRPKVTRLGVDVAGEVEAVGSNVSRFQPGDAVFGSCRGACAEYVCASESAVVAKPDGVTFEQAASAPVAALTALQALRDKGGLQAGQRVLINGAAGGVGTFAVQIARAFGAEVTGVCGTGNVEMVRSLGADHVIDYTREDFTRSGQRYDLLVDCFAAHPLLACRRVLSARGRYILVGGPIGSTMGLLAGLIWARTLSHLVSQKFVVFMTRPNDKDLAVVRGLMEAGKVTPVIDRCYALNEVPEAMRYLEEGHARGKVVITVEQRQGT